MKNLGNSLLFTLFSLYKTSNTRNIAQIERMALSSSSLLDLKAELLKKSEEVKRDKLQKASKFTELRNASKKPSIFSKKNTGVLQRAQRDLELKREEDDVMSQSRKKLEAKARLYEKMTGGSGVSEHDGSEGFLVDFEQKSLRTISDTRREQELKEEEERREDAHALEEHVPEPEDPSEQWVDFVDSFGRSRRCLRKDLPELQKMDKSIQRHSGDGKAPAENNPDGIQKPDLMSADMYRDMIREKWEEEERQNMTNPDGPTHYANVQYNEIRTHGVGYYQFDKDHGSREDQLSALKELREQTKDLREKKEKFKLKRKAILKARLAKVKQRKLVREGKDPSALEEESSSSSDEEHMIGPQPSEQNKGEGRTSPELLTRDETLRKDAPVRDWDLGKDKDEFNEEKWLSGRRDERVNEFAPPTFYYDKPNQRKHQNNKQGTNQKQSQSQFAPPSSYFESSTQKSDSVKRNKKTTMDPMSMLEQVTYQQETDDNKSDTSKENQASTEMAAEQNVIAGLQQIRSEMEISQCKSDSSSTIPQYPNANISQDDVRNKSDQWNIPENVLLLPPPPPPPPQPPGHITSGNQLNQPLLPNNFMHLPPPPLPPTVPHEYANEYTTHSNEPATYEYSNEINTAHHQDPSASQSNESGLLQNEYQTAVDSEASQENDKNKQSISGTEDLVKTVLKSSSAYISSAPVKYDRFTRPVYKPRYERVNLIDLPESLPAPPTAQNMPVYPSQEEVFGSKDAPKEKSEKDLQKSWYRQFQGQGHKNNKGGESLQDSDQPQAVIDRLKTKNIPFVSPFVQKDKEETVSEEKLEFDPSKPPPELKK